MAEWQPIETAPKDGTPILAYAPEWDAVQAIQWVPEGYGYPPFWGYCETLLSEVCPDADPTHWMPLPAPPK